MAEGLLWERGLGVEVIHLTGEGGTLPDESGAGRDRDPWFVLPLPLGETKRPSTPRTVSPVVPQVAQGTPAPTTRDEDPSPAPERPGNEK